MTATLIVSGLIVFGLRIAYRMGKTHGFHEGIQAMEETQCGHIVGAQDERNE